MSDGDDEYGTPSRQHDGPRSRRSTRRRLDGQLARGVDLLRDHVEARSYESMDTRKCLDSNGTPNQSTSEWPLLPQDRVRGSPMDKGMSRKKHPRCLLAPPRRGLSAFPSDSVEPRCTVGNDHEPVMQSVEDVAVSPHGASYRLAPTARVCCPVRASGSIVSGGAVHSGGTRRRNTMVWSPCIDIVGPSSVMSPGHTNPVRIRHSGLWVLIWRPHGPTRTALGGKEPRPHSTS